MSVTPAAADGRRHGAANTTGHVYLFANTGTMADLGVVSFDADQKGRVTLPETIAVGTGFRIAVVFDHTPLMWDTATVRPATVPSAPEAPTIAVSNTDAGTAEATFQDVAPGTYPAKVVTA